MSQNIEAPAPRAPRASITEMTELVLPQHANAVGTVFGGQVMAWMDICGAIAAKRHCGRTAVTAVVDELVFHAPMHVGDVVRLEARVNAAFNSSVEVEVQVQVENTETLERTRCVAAYMIFVAISDEGKTCGVPGLLCESDEDVRREKEARARREERLARKARRENLGK